MTELDVLARDVQVSGRTLRRAAERGTFRVRRPSERKVFVPVEERVYLRAHWPLLAGLVQALRTQANVRLAVLFGSVARGDEAPDSDLDVLVRLRRDDPRARAELAELLEAVSGRRVQLVSLEQAEEAPLLLSDVLRDGRVLVDRERDWPRLGRRAQEIQRHAADERARLDREAWRAPDVLAEIHARSGL